jgi:hypothetical protein
MPLYAIPSFAEGHHEGTELTPEGYLTTAGEGTWVSPVYTTPQPFTWAVASWNGAGEEISLQVRVQIHARWSPWFSFGRWSSTGAKASLARQEAEGFGKLSTDTLTLTEQTTTWQMQVQLRRATLKRAWLCGAMPSARSAEPAHLPAWGIDLPVPGLSQMIYEGGKVWCSPTSLAMVMAYWGHRESIPEQVVPGVYDPVYDGTGNWPFNTAYAGARGFVAWVDRLPGFADLERWIARGVPVICSVAYSREWLPNAVYPLTGGHLLVVRGFTEAGDVICNDPAADSDDGVRVVYQRDLFRRAWLDRGGVVYLLHPEDWGTN